MENTAFIDNIPFRINGSETILDFVRRNLGHEVIPTLCQSDNLENYGSCRVCSVEVALKEGRTGQDNGFVPYTGGIRLLHLSVH